MAQNERICGFTRKSKRIATHRMPLVKIIAVAMRTSSIVGLLCIVSLASALPFQSVANDILLYGDPINPNADLETMQRMKKMLVRGGLLYISFPVGRDAVVWTACRVYGPLRIPLLFEGWTLLGVYGAVSGCYEQVANIHTQPVFVLRNDGVQTEL